MPLFSKKSSDKIDYKARLERKLYLAREDPEPIFDLSECNLQAVHSGTFVLCRVLRKESLILKSNQLVNLNGGGQLQDLAQLSTLDLRCNRLKSLTSDIKYLSNLRELLLGHNCLSCLPEEIGQLQALQKLDVSNNCLKKVPPILGQLPSLCLLDLRSNPLKSLPTELPNNDTLQILTDSELLPDKGERQISNPVIVQELKQSPKKKTEMENESEQLVALLEARRKKQLELIRRLASFEEEQRCSLASVLKHQREQQNLALVVAQTEEDNLTALSGVRELIEARSSELAQNILHDEEENRVMLRDVLHREEARNLELMKALAAEEEAQRSRLATVLSALPDKSAPLLQMVLKDEQFQLSVLAAVRAKQEAQLSRCVIDDELLRQAALAAVREKGDEQARQIAHEVAQVQAQLSFLTAQELKRRSELTTETLNDLSDRRIVLSAALSSLLKEQSTRRLELLDEVTSQLEGVGEALWLIQLERLLSCPPPSLESGVTALRDLAAALPSVSKQCDSASAPPFTDLSPVHDDLQVPSAPRISPSAEECAVCMDQECAIVFLPCGHVCCCPNCAIALDDCPLCRAEILNKIPLVANCQLVMS